MSGARRHAGAAIAVAGFLVLATAGTALAAAPANDDWAGATAIVLHDGAAIDLAEATVDAGDPAPCHSGDTEYRSVWYSYTATEAGPTVIGFYSGDPVSVHVLSPDGATQLACDVGGQTFDDNVPFDAALGETYRIVVAATSDVATSGGIGAALPLVVTGEPPKTGHVTPAGDATFVWAFACSESGTIEPEIDLVQGSGSSQAMGSVLETVNCHPPGVSIPLTVPHGSGDNPDARFRNGSAQAFFQWDAFSFGQQAKRVTTTGTVTLSGGPAIAPPQTDVAATGSAPDTPGLTDWALAAIGVLAALAVARMAVRLRRSPGTGAGTSA